MGVLIEDVVHIESGKEEGDPWVIYVSCPDKTGLGCDLCRVILEFGLCITKADGSIDGKWCYIVFWVIPRPGLRVRWASLESRLVSVCPPCSVSYYYERQPSPSQVYLLKVFRLDRRGLLHDVTQVLCGLHLTLLRVKASITPDGRVMDLFFITDGMELLHTKERQDEIYKHLEAVMGESCISCEFQLVGPEYDIIQQGFSSLPPAAEELFTFELPDNQNHAQALTPDLSRLTEANITVDISLRPAFTRLQIHCVDQKGLLYDIMRTLKDCNIQIAYGKSLSNMKGYCEVELFIQQMDGKKIIDPEKRSALLSQLRMEMLHPLRVVIANRGPDTELLVANPVELSGKGRPRVFYDVTLALKMLGICFFSAEIGRHSTSDRKWEVYRFLLDETCEFPLGNDQARAKIVDRVRRTLMGW